MRIPLPVAWPLVFLLGACGAHLRPTDRGPGPVVTLQVEVKDEGGTSLVKLNEPLRSGDEFALLVRSERKLYLYAVQQGVSGALTPLDGAADAGPAEPGSERHIPREGWLKLGGIEGAGALLLIAAPQALDAAQVEGEARRTPVPCGVPAGDKVEKKREPEPSSQQNGTRGDKDTVPGCADRRGVVLVRFPLRRE